VERKRPGGIGIADLQPFLRPSPEAQEESHEWRGVTERMVDEVDERKRKNKVYDMRLEPSEPHTNRIQLLNPRKSFILTKAFMKWGGFASSPSHAETINPSTTPTFDDLIARGSRFIKTDGLTATTTEDEAPPPPSEEPHKRFNYEFDEPTRSTGTQTSVSSRESKASSAQPQSLLTMQREGKRLSRKQMALLQAAAISRGSPPNLAETKEEPKEAEATSDPRIGTDEEKKQFRNKVWGLVGGKWF